ncbi:MAG: hypothetical protein QOJ50_1960, partial [Cryptosporangiaceae bacterium]|nr:hypothetical protein [Cryptosporangiaceae bacterium]
RRALINIGLVLLTLIIAVTISLIVARSMVRPLTRLRGSALEVANHSLPDLVRRLREDEESPPDTASLRAGSTHNRIDLPAIDPVEIHSNDEIGQVARAFNAVQLEAVRVATEQAQLRRSVSTMFVNLSRRSQLLVDRLIRLIDNLEQGEQDPDRLSDLFKLDHLATRMRRNDENLLVLAGADAGRRWNQPASLVDVLRAATAEVEQYTRVRLGTVDETIEVAARAVNDMVHLVAELLENATSFSSPRTDVVINARRSGEEAIIEIEDQGIGMAKEQMEELNDRLARPPVFDVSVSRMMGLFVVGRLATRHHVGVHLKSANSGGTMAVVALSPEVLTPSQFGRPGLGADVPPIVAQRVESERMDTGLLESGRGDAARGQLASNAENGRPIPGDQFRSEPFRPEPPRQDPFRPEPSRPEPSRADAGLDSETTRIEPVRAQSSGLKEESQRIPTIDSTVIPPANLPALPAPGRPVPQQSQQPVSPAAAGSPADTGQIRAVTPPPAARAPLAPSATESATGQFVQLGPIDEPSGKSGLGVSSAAAAMAVLRSAQAPPPVPPSIQPPPPVPPVPVQQQPAIPFDSPNGSARELLSGPADPASMDATIEMPLPIFDAIESEWFRSAPRPTPLLGNDFAGPPAPPVAQPVAPVVSQPVSQPASAPVRPAPAPQSAQPAAARVSTPAEKAATAPGLPIRTPGKVTDSGAPVGDLGGPHAPSRPQETAAAAASAPVRPAPERPAATPVERPVSSDPLAGPPVPGSPLSSGSLSGRPVPATEPPTAQRPAAQYPDRPAAQNGTPSGVTFHPPVSAVPTSSPAATAPISAEPGSSKWVSPADAGWKAAQAAAEAKPEATTTGGLPKRVPMAHFVPGRVDNQQKKTPKSTAHRSPDAVRGVLSSYRHGLEQGRQATQSKHSVATENDEQEEM